MQNNKGFTCFLGAGVVKRYKPTMVLLETADASTGPSPYALQTMFPYKTHTPPKVVTQQEIDTVTQALIDSYVREFEQYM